MLKDMDIGPSDWVPAEGDHEAELCIVGEAPGKTEVQMKRPFVGPAGTILNDCLRSARITRSSCYLTNIFKRPVVKSGGLYKIEGRAIYREGKGFTKDGQEWADNLIQELAEHPASVVVAMGEAAINALTGQFSPLKTRGSIYFNEKLPGKHIVACVHPSYTQYSSYLYRYFIIYDLRKAADRIGTPAKYEDRLAIIGPDKPTALHWIDRFYNQGLAGKPITIDLEIYHHEISCFGIGTSHEAICVPTMRGGSHYWMEHDEAELWLAIDKIVNDPRVELVFQNGMFDLWVLLRNHMVPQGTFQDTMVGWNLMYPDQDFGKSLAIIASVYTDLPYYKEEFKEWTASQMNKEIGDRMDTLWNYNCKDVFATAEGYDKMKVELKEGKFWDTYRRTMNLYPALLYMTTRGIKINSEALVKTKHEIEAEEIKLQTELNEIVGHELNPNSPKQLQNYFYVEKGVAPYKDRKTKKPTLNDDALRRLCKPTAIRPAFREAAIIREMRGLKKLRGTYLEINLDTDSRLRCSLNPAGTKNGRLSSSKTLFGTGTNMQNLPSQFKKFLEADDGNVLIEMDKVQGEWVLVAFFAGDSNMLEVVYKNLDAHTHTAFMSFGIPKELIAADHKLVGHLTNAAEIHKLRKEFLPEILQYNPPGSMSARQAGKKSNHGLNYDMGYKTFALVNELPEKEAKRITESYHQGYPGIRNNFHASIRDQLSRTRSLYNPFGRRRIFYDRWGDSLFKDAYAFPAQSTLVDITNSSLVEMYQDQNTARWKYLLELLMQVHDSNLIQYPAINFRYNRMARAVFWMRDAMEPYLEWQGREIKVATDMKMGLNWGEYHPEHNPLGMREVRIAAHQEEMERNLRRTHLALLEDKRNL